jgi:hypothetical protein
LLGRILPAALVAALAAWEIVATRCDATSVPRDDAWDAAAAVVRAQYKPGDLIVFAPDWVDPVGRLHLGDLIPIETAGRMDDARFGRIWELSIRGAHAPDVAHAHEVASETHGGVTVARYEQSPAIVLTDFVKASPAQRVLAEVGFAPHQCLQLIPGPKHPVRVTIDATLGTKLVGYVGLADVFTRRDIRDPGFLDVEIGGQRVASVTAGVDDGWVRFEVPTQPGAAQVTFVAHADARDRHICVAAEARQ